MRKSTATRLPAEFVTTTCAVYPPFASGAVYLLVMVAVPTAPLCGLSVVTLPLDGEKVPFLNSYFRVSAFFPVTDTVTFPLPWARMVSTTIAETTGNWPAPAPDTAERSMVNAAVRRVSVAVCVPRNSTLSPSSLASAVKVIGVLRVIPARVPTQVPSDLVRFAVVSGSSRTPWALFPAAVMVTDFTSA